MIHPWTLLLFDQRYKYKVAHLNFSINDLSTYRLNITDGHILFQF